MSRPIEVKVIGWDDGAITDPQNPVAWWEDYKRVRRYGDCRIFHVKYNGEQVLVGALSRRMTTKDPWADAGGTFADLAGEVDFDQFLQGVRRGSPNNNPMRIRYIFHAKNRYWVMWVKYLLYRRQKGYRGSYETLLGSFDTAIRGRAANLYGRINSLYRRVRKTPEERRAREQIRRDAQDALTEQEAEEILLSLDDDGTGFGVKQAAINF